MPASDRPLLSFVLYVIGAAGMLALLVMASRMGDRAQQVRLAAVAWWLAIEGLRLWISFRHRRRSHRLGRHGIVLWGRR